MNVNLRLLKTKIELLWWVGGVDGARRGVHNHFHALPKYSVEVVL